MGFKQTQIPFFFLLLCCIALLPAGCDRDNGISPPAAGKAPRMPGKVLDPDSAQGAVSYSELLKAFGPLTKPRKHYRIGVVTKFFGNPYYHLLTEGMHAKGEELGLFLDFQAGAAESDQEGQRAVLETMIGRGYDAILVSPQTDVNLAPVVEKARQKGIMLLNVDTALLPGADYYIGPNQYESGVKAARYLMSKASGGKVAVIKGVEADYGGNQRSRGFVDSLGGSSFLVVSEHYSSWDLQTALQSAADILVRHPDIRAFYCGNDITALGVARAVSRAGKSGKVIVIGRDGIDQALDLVGAGEMTGTVAAYPFEMGRIAVEIAVRALDGQSIPRVVVTPQKFIDSGNLKDRRQGRVQPEVREAPRQGGHNGD